MGTTWIMDRLLPETAAGVPTEATPFTSGSSLASVVHAARAWLSGVWATSSSWASKPLPNASAMVS